MITPFWEKSGEFPREIQTRVIRQSPHPYHEVDSPNHSTHSVIDIASATFRGAAICTDVLSHIYSFS